MLSNKSMFFITLVIFLFIGCGSNKSQVSIPTKSNNTQKLTTLPIKINSHPKKEISKPIVQETIDQTPKWIFTPNKDNYICAIGSSKIINKNYEMANKIALLTAKARISEEISVYIESSNTLSKICNTNECKSSYDSKISQQSTNMLKSVKQTDTYNDKDNSLLYVRACTKTN